MSFKSARLAGGKQNYTHTYIYTPEKTNNTIHLAFKWNVSQAVSNVLVKSWLFIQIWSVLGSAFYNKLHRWADGQKQGNNAQGLMFNCCPLSQTGSPFSLRRRGRKAKYKCCFYQKVHTRKKINKITMYQWKPTHVQQNLHGSKPRLWGSSPAAHIPCGFALISCKLMYWQSRALGELGRAGADPAVTCRVFPLRPSRSVWLISSATESDTSQGTQDWWGGCLTPARTAAVSPLSPALQKELLCWKNGICAEIFGFHNNTKGVLSLLWKLAPI